MPHSLTHRLGILGAGFLSTAISLGAVLLLPAIVSAQCNFGNCSIPSGYCVSLNGWCQRNEYVLEYYDSDCDGGLSYCERDICWFFDKLSDGSCPTDQYGAVCYDSDVFFCNGESGNCMFNCHGNAQCECENCNGGTWICEGSVCGCGTSPILINVRNNSPQDHLSSATEGVMFDINGNGVPERVAWPQDPSSVGLLALDNNGNGVIDNGSELFGTVTRLRDGHLAANGFVALAEFDENRDDQIDAHDAIFPRLRVWFDLDRNGRSEAAELWTLRQAGVVAISTRYRETRRRDQFGNWYRFAGSAMMRRGWDEVERRIFDVILTTTQH